MIEEIEQSANVRVGNASGELHFPSEPLRCGRVQGDIRPYGFQSYAFIQFEVFRFIDLAHAPASDEANDSKTIREDLPRQELGNSGGEGRSFLKVVRMGIRPWRAHDTS